MSKFAHPEFRVRFRFFAGFERRPGWYVDTVAVSTSALEGLPRLDGDPNKPGCGFGATEYAGPAFDATLPDPCVMGKSVVSTTVVRVRPPGNVPPPSASGSVVSSFAGAGSIVALLGTEQAEFEVPSAGAVCVVVTNGTGDPASRVGGGRVLLDGQEIVSPDGWTRSMTVIRRRQPVAAGKHTLQVIVAPGASLPRSAEPNAAPSVYAYGVMYQPGNAMPAPFSGSANVPGGGGRITNFSTGRYRGDPVAKFELESALPAVGGGKQGYVAPFVVQIADLTSCRQVREVRGLMRVGTSTSRGWEETMASAGFAWDGRDESGRLVRSDRTAVRIFVAAALAGLDIFPLPTSGAPEPRGGPGPLDGDNWTIPTGPAVLHPERFAPVRLVRWFRTMFTPHQGPFCAGASLACGIDTIPELAWSCAPNATWLSSGGAARWTVTGRRICLSGCYPAGSAYDVRFEQDGVGFGKADCRSLVVLSHTGEPTLRTFQWLACYLGPDISGAPTCVGGGEHFTDEEGIWVHLFAGFSPDGSVMVRSTPYTGRRMAVSLYDMYERSLRLRGPWYDSTVTGIPAGRIRTNKVVSVSYGSATFVSETSPVPVDPPDPNEP